MILLQEKESINFKVKETGTGSVFHHAYDTEVETVDKSSFLLSLAATMWWW